MPTTILRYATALSLLLCFTARAKADSAADSFLSAIQNALHSKNISDVTQLYDLHDASKRISDLTLQPWTFLFKDLDKGWAIQEIKYMSKSDFLASSPSAAADIQVMTEPNNIDGKTYTLSPELVGVLQIILSKGGGNENATMGVGLNENGALILMSMKEK